MHWIPLLEDATSRFAGIAVTGDLDAPVPTCPAWTLADLVQHLGETHLWAAHAVEHGNPDGDERFEGRVDELAGWYGDAARRLVAVLAATDPQAPAWTFGQEKLAGFWRRRQVHETLMHLYDALAVDGREGDWAIEPELAWDGVDEVATVFYPRQVRLDRIAPIDGTLRLVATDLDREPLDIGTTHPVAELSGPAARLLLALWKRVPVDDPDAARLLDTAITP
jgi:uncharacterized protein (TIGR03083 family)